MANNSPYEVLNIESGASSRDIKIRYRNLVREFPPEHHPDKFMEIRAAYDELMSTEMTRREFFPMYLKPMDYFKDALNSSSDVKDNRLLLGQVFETPFNTLEELKLLYHKK